MQDDIHRWLSDQLEANDPNRVGLPGAVQSIDAIKSLGAFEERGRAMVFGLQLPEDASRERARELADEGRARIRRWAASLDDETAEALSVRFTQKTLRFAGLEIEPRPMPAVAGRVRCTFEVTVVRFDLDTGTDEKVRDPAVLRRFDGLRPASGEGDHLEDLPVLEDDWLLSASVRLRFEAADETLVCDLDLECDRAPDEALLREAAQMGHRLWSSSWSMHVEWEQPDAPGFGSEAIALLSMREEPRSVEVLPLAEP